MGNVFSCAFCKPEHETGPKALDERGCTDVLCFLLFVVVCGGIIGIGMFAFATGNVDQIVYPADYLGQYCGKDGTNVADYPYAFYPRLDKDIIDQAGVIAAGYWWKFLPYTVCVASCPTAFSFNDDTAYGGCSYPGADCSPGSGVPHNTYYSGFHTTSMLKRCFPIIESDGGTARALCATPNCTAAGKTCTTPQNTPDVDYVWEVTDDADDALCERKITEEVSVFFKPADQTADSYTLTQEFAEYVTWVYQFTRALEEGIFEMCITGFLGPILMGFLWVVLLWLFAGVIVIAALAFLVVLLLVLTTLCYIKAGWAPSLTDYLNSTAVQTYAYDSVGSGDEQTAFSVAAVIMTCVLVLVVMMLVMWRKCIARCIAIIKESTKVFRAIPGLIGWPIITVAFLSAVTVWGVMVPFYIFYGDVEQYYDNYQDVLDAIDSAVNGTGSVSDYLSSDSAHKWVLFGIHLFGILWIIEFIKACAWITMSGAVCYWYFFRDNEEHKEKYPLLNSARRVMRYHLGSAAFGALVIAICQFIRYALATLDHYTKDLQDANFLFKMVIKCAHCGMWCLQKTIEFISYFGFIYIALQGTNFCESCKKTFEFLLVPKNAAQTAVNKTIEKIIVLVMVWTTPTFLAMLCYAWLDNQSDYSADNNALYPAIMVWVVAFFLADAIALVFECTIDTIFLCSFKDAKEYDGKHMSADMREAFGLDKDVTAIATPIQTSADFKDHRAKSNKNLGAPASAGTNAGASDITISA